MEFTYRRRGETLTAVVMTAVRVSGTERVPLVLASVPGQAVFPVISICCKRFAVAVERAEEFLLKNPSFRGAILADDNGAYSFGPQGRLFLVNLPHLGKVDEGALARVRGALAAKQVAIDNKAAIEAAYAQIRGLGGHVFYTCRDAGEALPPILVRVKGTPSKEWGALAEALTPEERGALAAVAAQELLLLDLYCVEGGRKAYDAARVEVLAAIRAAKEEK